MSTLSTFVLGLLVFLQSSVLLEWFTFEARFIGWVGVVFVAVLVFEAIRGPIWVRK